MRIKYELVQTQENEEKHELFLGTFVYHDIYGFQQLKKIHLNALVFVGRVYSFAAYVWEHAN